MSPWIYAACGLLALLVLIRPLNTLTASKIHLNVSGVTLTPATGSPIALSEVDDVDTDRSGESISRYGDARKYARLVCVVKNKRTVKIMGASRAQMAAVVQGAPYTITWNELDAVNQAAAGGGGLAWTAINAVCHKNPFQMKNNQYGTGSLEFECFSIDDSDPISYTPL